MRYDHSNGFRFFAPKVASGKIFENCIFRAVCVATTSASDSKKIYSSLVFEAI
jgi:hypothetical protein